MGHKTKTQRNNLIVAAYNLGLPTKIIAHMYGISDSRTIYIVHRHGCAYRNFTPRNRFPCQLPLRKNRSRKSPSTSSPATSEISSSGNSTGQPKSAK
jgi:hypothetical protein